MRACPHPRLIKEVLAGEHSRYVRVAAPAQRIRETYDLLRQRPFVPLHVADRGGRVIYEITSQRVATELARMLLPVDLLGNLDAPNDSDLYLLRDDLAKTSGFGSPDGGAQKFFAGSDGPLLLSATKEGLVVALPAGRSPGQFHFAEARHGHTLKLIPDPLLLEPAVVGAPSPFAAGPGPGALLTDNECEVLRRSITDEAILDLVERYSGVEPLSPDDPRRVRSRHIAHAEGDNERVVMALARDLAAAGEGRLQVRLGRFSHRGLTLHNVEAELPGASPELVLVTAHLDSTAANDPGYDEEHGSAPGADDDASGVAAVLLIARSLARLAEAAPAARTIRFVLFNAEEEGLVGSRVYARQQREREAPIVAVFQMDMIGYHEEPPRNWEVHAGYAQSAEVEARSLALARVLRQVSPIISPALKPPQVYASRGDPEGDPAAGRSDHAPFQAQGYAACVTSEDFFIGPAPDSPDPQRNPNYHRVGDTTIVPDFAADIARVVAAAVWVTAKSGAGKSPQFAARSSSFGVEETFMTSREIDTGDFQRTTRPFATAMTASSSGSRRVSIDTSRAGAGRSTASAFNELDAANLTEIQPTGSLVSRALTLLRTERARGAGFVGSGHTDGSDFIPDPVTVRTSSVAQIVHFQQFYRGLPVFRTGNLVSFGPKGEGEVKGESVVFETEVDTEPTIQPTEAVAAAAEFLASAKLRQFKDEFGEVSTEQPLALDGFEPKVIAGFPMLPTRPTVLDWVASSNSTQGQENRPFSKPIPAHLLIFDQPAGPRLGWYVVLSRDEQFEQYAVIVSADIKPGEVTLLQRHGA